MNYAEKQQEIADIIKAALLSEGITKKDALIEANGNHPDQIVLMVTINSKVIGRAANTCILGDQPHCMDCGKCDVLKEEGVLIHE